jgi:hypothetical protein
MSLASTHVVSNRAVSRREGSSELPEADWRCTGKARKACPFGHGLDSTLFARQTELQKRPLTRVACVGITT